MIYQTIQSLNLRKEKNETERLKEQVVKMNSDYFLLNSENEAIKCERKNIISNDQNQNQEHKLCNLKKYFCYFNSLLEKYKSITVYVNYPLLGFYFSQFYFSQH